MACLGRAGFVMEPRRSRALAAQDLVITNVRIIVGNGR